MGTPDSSETKLFRGQWVSGARVHCGSDILDIHARGQGVEASHAHVAGLEVAVGEGAVVQGADAEHNLTRRGFCTRESEREEIEIMIESQQLERFVVSGGAGRVWCVRGRTWWKSLSRWGTAAVPGWARRRRAASSVRELWHSSIWTQRHRGRGALRRMLMLDTSTFIAWEGVLGYGRREGYIRRSDASVPDPPPPL